jgi:hypothetical protein
MEEQFLPETILEGGFKKNIFKILCKNYFEMTISSCCPWQITFQFGTNEIINTWLQFMLIFGVTIVFFNRSYLSEIDEPILDFF